MDTTYAIDDVVLDSYGNPAVVTRVDAHSLSITQTVGSDQGRRTSIPLRFTRKITDPDTIAWARARTERRPIRRGY